MWSKISLTDQAACDLLESNDGDDVEGRSSGQLQGKDEQCASVGMSAPTRLGNGQGVPEETVENVECVEESVDKRETGRNRVTLHST